MTTTKYVVTKRTLTVFLALILGFAIPILMRSVLQRQETPAVKGPRMNIYQRSEGGFSIRTLTEIDAEGRMTARGVTATSPEFGIYLIGQDRDNDGDWEYINFCRTSPNTSARVHYKDCICAERRAKRSAYTPCEGSPPRTALTFAQGVKEAQYRLSIFFGEATTQKYLTKN